MLHPKMAQRAEISNAECERTSCREPLTRTPVNDSFVCLFHPVLGLLPFSDEDIEEAN